MRVIRPATRLIILILLFAGFSYPQKPCPTPLHQVAGNNSSASQLAIGSASSSKDEPGRKLLIIADNQEHLLTGGPLRSMSPISDSNVTSVALRSPLVNVGGLQLLREALRFGRGEGVDLVLHLGDAVDISCPDELSSVFNVLEKEAKGIWFMAPGNHDGLLAGTHADFQPSIDFDISKHPWIYTMPPVQGPKGVERGWLNACLSPTNFKDKTSGAGILTKGDVIKHYWEKLKIRSKAAPEELTGAQTQVRINGKIDNLNQITIEKTNVECKFEKIKIESQGYTGIARICPRTRVKGKAGDKDGKWVGPYASFIIQKLEVGGTTIILLDTSYYLNPTWYRVGLSGSITEYQMKLVEKFFFGSANRNNVIFAGHHPFDKLPENEQRWITENSGRYISAHVHRATNLIKHQVKRREIMELNIGSTLDFPPQAVIAKLTPDAMFFRVAGADVAKTGWPGFLEKCEAHRAEWMLNREVYRDYTRGPYVKHLLESLREAESVRQAAAVAPLGPELVIPTGTKVRDWLLLDHVLKGIREDETGVGLFWACQAYYASEATQLEISLLDSILDGLGFGSKAGCEATGSEFSFFPPKP